MSPGDEPVRTHQDRAVAADLPVALPGAPEPWGISWITAMFLHGGWDHILGNMLFLAVFGKNVEDAYGAAALPDLLFRRRFVAIMIQTAMTLLFGTPADGRVSTLGASGAVAAALGVSIILRPGSRVRTPSGPRSPSVLDGEAVLRWRGSRREGRR